MQRTKIEWVQNRDGTSGYTWNPVTGCLGNCSFCYARRIAERFAGTKAFPRGFKPVFHQNRLEEPHKLKKPSRIFVCSMGELYGDWVKPEWITSILKVIEDNPQHVFQILTKYPQNIRHNGCDNLWLGTSIDRRKDLIRLEDLKRKVSAPSVLPRSSLSINFVRFVSFEPLLEVIEPDLTGMDWVILGGLSGAKPFYPPEEWLDTIKQAARSAGAKIFEKWNLKEYWTTRSPIQEFPRVPRC